MPKAPKPKLSVRNGIKVIALWVVALLAIGFLVIQSHRPTESSVATQPIHTEFTTSQTAFTPPSTSRSPPRERVNPFAPATINGGTIERNYGTPGAKTIRPMAPFSKTPYAKAQSPRPTAFSDTSPTRNTRQHQDIIKQAVRTPKVDDGLIGHWDFEETDLTDNEVADLTGNHQVGTVRGARRVPNGVKGQALYFDGQGARVTGSDVRFPNGNAPSSFAFWVNYTGKPGVVFSYGMPDTRAARGVALLDEATVKFFGWQSDHDCIVGVIGDGSWHHITANYTGSHVELWIDGNLSCSAPKQWSTYTGMRWIMGRNPIESYSADDFYGFLDDVRVYNRALRQVDIQNVMAEAYYDPIPIRAAR